MSIDIGRELTVRCIAHNIGLKCGPYNPQGPLVLIEKAGHMAQRLADAFEAEVTNAAALADAAVALWQATGFREPDPIEVSVGTQPERSVRDEF